MRLLAVINPSAADFDAQRRWPGLEAQLGAHADLVVVETALEDDESARRISAALASQHFDRVVSIGGDGTTHLTLNALLGARPDDPPTFAIIPFGTANDVAKSLGLPIDDPDRLAAIAVAGRVVALDVCRVMAELGDGQLSERYWLDSLTVGMDADILAARSRYRELGGYLAYAAALAERSIQQESLDASIDLDGRMIHDRVFNVVINNVPIYAGELVLPGSRYDDGLLDVYLFNRREYVSKLLAFAIKQADVLNLGLDAFLEDLTDNQRELHGRAVTVRLAFPRKVQVDGELLGEAREITASVARQIRVVASLETV